MPNRPEINKEILIWFRGTYGRDQEKFARFLGIPTERLQSLEDGTDLPKFSELKKIAQKLQVPYMIFYSPEAPKYFKPRDIKMRHLLQRSDSLDPQSWHLIMWALRAKDLYEILSEGEKTSEKLKSLISSEKNVNILATRARELLGVTVDQQLHWGSVFEAYKTWRAAVERLGVIVLQGRSDLNDFRGFSIIDSEPYMIVINKADEFTSPRIFTLMHELGHILLGEPSLCSQDDIFHAQRGIEFDCNRFAAALLMPAKAVAEHPIVKQTGKHDWDDDRLIKLASRVFKVSRMAMAIRLVELGFMEQAWYESRLPDWEVRPEKPGFGRLDDPIKRMAITALNANGFRFTSAVLSRMQSGSISTSYACDILNVKTKYLSELSNLIIGYAH